MAASDANRSLENTPTWAVATICTMFVLVSFVGERTVYLLGRWLTKTRRKPLLEALEKMKEELMLLGFISLVITVTSQYLTKICIHSNFYDKQRMACKLNDSQKSTEHFQVWTEVFRRQMASTVNTCKEDHEPFISLLGLEQLHRFIFVMAVTHVLYSCMTMLLAIVKVHGWSTWEEEAHELANNRENLAELTRSLTLKRQSTFVEYHAARPWSRNRIFLWIVCFFRQFGQSVTKSDYLALRLGFITKHNTGDKYDFHSYMIRSMEYEFKDVVGISPPLWAFVVAFMLFNVDGTNLYFWLSLFPIILVSLVGAKLQNIIATLALENAGLSGPLRGVNLKPRDELFWFNKPRLLLHLIHFILFQVAFELATFFWVWWQFGWLSCLFNNRAFVYVRIFSGFIVQIFCSYSTLPLYALVTQMGSMYKMPIFEDNNIEFLHDWHRGNTPAYGNEKTTRENDVEHGNHVPILEMKRHYRRHNYSIGEDEIWSEGYSSTRTYDINFQKSQRSNDSQSWRLPLEGRTWRSQSIYSSKTQLSQSSRRIEKGSMPEFAKEKTNMYNSASTKSVDELALRSNFLGSKEPITLTKQSWF